MAYKRGNRPSFYFDGRIEQGGRKQLSTGTTNPTIAKSIELMWETLATRERAWDVLGKVLAGDLSTAQLWDRYVAAKTDLFELRRSLHDTNLEPHVADFLTWTGKQGWNVDHVKSIARNVRTLVPAGVPFPASRATTDALTTSLTEYGDDETSPNTHRRVHSNWSVFFTYLRDVKRVFATNPMDAVPRPDLKKLPPRFYTLAEVERVVDWQPTAQRRAYFAALYGTGVDTTDMLDVPGKHEAVRAMDLNPKTHEFRAPGTKAHTRDRMVVVTDWAWPLLWQYAKTLQPQAELFPTFDRWMVYDWHAQTVGDGTFDTHGVLSRAGLALKRRYPPKNARHHWAVFMFQAGAAVHFVQQQLGHSTAKLTLDTYGQYRTDASHRKLAMEQATAYALTLQQVAGAGIEPATSGLWDRRSDPG